MPRITVQDEPDQVTLKLEGNPRWDLGHSVRGFLADGTLKIRRSFAPPGFSGS
jgi:hypothetical protein